MKAENKNMLDFIKDGSKVFIVPVYQRNYEWSVRNCDDLWRDIVRSLETNESHFCGTICYKEEHKNGVDYFYLIDGQQRITSVFLMLKAAYDLSTSEEIQRYLEDILILQFSVFSKYSEDAIRLHLNVGDFGQYKLLLQNRFDELDKKSVVYQNYNYFRKQLGTYMTNNDALKKFVLGLNKIEVIGLQIENENPQTIFSSLNSTGKYLSSVDLIRNELFMQFSYDEQLKLYTFWHSMEEKLGDKMESFFLDYLLYKNRDYRIRSVYSKVDVQLLGTNLQECFFSYYHICGCYKNYERTEDFLCDMENKAVLYADFCMPQNFAIYDDVVMRKFGELYSFSGKGSFGCLLLCFADLYDSNDMDSDMMVRCLDAFISYLVRLTIVLGKSLDAKSSSLIVKYVLNESYGGTYEDRFWTYIGKGVNAMPSNGVFQNSLCSYNFHRNDKLWRYMLAKYVANDENMDVLDVLEKYKFEIICPASKNPVWQNYLSRKDAVTLSDFVKCIGNAVFVEEFSNVLSFDEKKSVYATSVLKETQRVSKYGSWGRFEIERRSKKIADVLVSVFNYPDKYQLATLSKDNQYFLDMGDVDDFSVFTNRKPSSLVLYNDEFQVNNWKALFRQVCDALYDENADVFLKIADLFDFFFITSDNDAPVAFEFFRDVIYIRNNMATRTLLGNLARFVRKYDDMCHTSWMENIMFMI